MASPPIPPPSCFGLETTLVSSEATTPFYFSSAHLSFHDANRSQSKPLRRPSPALLWCLWSPPGLARLLCLTPCTQTCPPLFLPCSLFRCHLRSCRAACPPMVCGLLTVNPYQPLTVYSLKSCSYNLGGHRSQACHLRFSHLLLGEK